MSRGERGRRARPGWRWAHRAVALLLLAGGAARAGGFEDIVRAAHSQTHDESCARMLEWVDGHPRDPQAPRGLVWMGQMRMADRQWGRARPLFERVEREYPGTEWELHSVKALADLDLAGHRFGRAIAGYDLLAASPSPFFQYVGRMAAVAARGERLRFDTAVGLGVLMALVLTLRLVPRGPGALWPLPRELAWVLPLPVLMLLAAPGQPPEEAHAVVTVALGGAALLWLNGAYLRGRPPTRAGRWAHAAFGLAQVVVLVYAALVLNGLWDKFRDTLAMGAD